MLLTYLIYFYLSSNKVMTVLRFTSLLSICFIYFLEVNKISAVTDFPINPQMPTVAALLHDLPY